MPMTLSAARAHSQNVFSGRPVHLEIDDDQRGAPSLALYLRQLHPSSTRQHFGRNEIMFQEGDRAERVYRVISGTVRLCRHAANGTRHIADFVLPGELIGFDERTTHPFTAEAVTPVTLLSYARSSFDRLVASTPAVRAHLVSLLTANLRAAEQQAFVLGAHTAKQRVASFLLRLAGREDAMAGERLDVPMSRNDIADYLGMTIETVCRALAALRDENIVTVPNSHQFILNDVGALRAIAVDA